MASYSTAVVPQRDPAVGTNVRAVAGGLLLLTLLAAPLAGQATAPHSGYPVDPLSVPRPEILSLIHI